MEIYTAPQMSIKNMHLLLSLLSIVSMRMVWLYVQSFNLVIQLML